MANWQEVEFDDIRAGDTVRFSYDFEGIHYTREAVVHNKNETSTSNPYWETYTRQPVIYDRNSFSNQKCEVDMDARKPQYTPGQMASATVYNVYGKIIASDVEGVFIEVVAGIAESGDTQIVFQPLRPDAPDYRYFLLERLENVQLIDRDHAAKVPKEIKKYVDQWVDFDHSATQGFWDGHKAALYDIDLIIKGLSEE